MAAKSKKKPASRGGKKVKPAKHGRTLAGPKGLAGGGGVTLGQFVLVDDSVAPASAGHFLIGVAGYDSDSNCLGAAWLDFPTGSGQQAFPNWGPTLARFAMWTNYAFGIANPNVWSAACMPPSVITLPSPDGSTVLDYHRHVCSAGPTFSPDNGFHDA